MKELSVIIPMYNVEAYIAQCLDSLLPYTGDNMEVILVNDGSTDSTLSICSDYKERYPEIVIVNKENGGLSDARNYGMKYATGNYTFFLDSDDWLAPDALSQMLSFMQREHCDMVQCAAYYVDGDNYGYDTRFVQPDTPPYVVDRHKAIRMLLDQFELKNFAWGKIYKTELVKRYPFRKGVYFEDVYWQHYMIHHSERIGIMPAPLYYYRQRRCGISGAFSLKNLDLFRGYEERLPFIKQYYPDQYYWALTRFWDDIYTAYFFTHRYMNDEIKSAFKDYFFKCNEKYQIDFDEHLLPRLQRYRFYRKYPKLLPLYHIYDTYKVKFDEWMKYRKKHLKQWRKKDETGV